MGRCDHQLHQGFPTKTNQILGGHSAIFFGDFAQLPPIDDTPLYFTTTRNQHSLTMEGRRVFESFNQSITVAFHSIQW